MNIEASALLLVVRNTLVIYLFLIVMFRLIGRRQLGQMTVVDLAIIIIMGSAVETAMINGDVSLEAGLVCAATLLVADRFVAILARRFRRLSHLLGGGPVLLVHCGHFIEAHLRRAGLTQADVEAALREREVNDVTKVRFAVLETDGSIDVIRLTDTPQPAHVGPAGPEEKP